MQIKKLPVLGTLALLCAAMTACNGNKEVGPWEEMEQVLAEIKAPEFPDKTFVITDYYNGSDSLYTDAINNAIAACSEQGGGMVVIPDGVFRTAAIRLKSNVNLHLSDSTVLQFATDPMLYPTVLTRIEGMDCYNLSPLIYAYDETNVAVTGNGVLDGCADRTNWLTSERIHGIEGPDGKRINEKSALYQMKEDSVPFKDRVFEGEKGIRPQFINFYKCNNVLLEGITIHNSPFWLIHPLMCENVTLHKVKMQSHGVNNDGCDPESCKNVLIDDCDFDTGDDCIAIKSGRDQDGRYWNIPCENIIVRNCRMKDGHAGVAIGSEITGGCFNVWVENCEMDSPELARIIRIKSNAERGGEVANVYVRNINVGECKKAILGFELKYWYVDDGPYPPYFHNIHLENIKSKKSRYVLHLEGFDDKIQARDIYLKDCVFDGVTDPELNNVVGVENIQFDNVIINGKEFTSL